MSESQNTDIISVSVPQTETTERKNNTVVASTNNDVLDILKKIRTHLARLKYSSAIDFNKNLQNDRVLNIGNYKISRECLLHYLGGNPDFLKQYADQCSSAIKNFSNEAGNLDLSSLINLSENKDFVRDTTFYKNLYGFNISLADYIANSNEFKNTNFNTQARILTNYQEFLRQSIDYIGRYMKNYQVIDDNLINSSYNLMYLLNSITFRRANMGKNIYEIQSIYTALVDAINNNLTIYDSLNTNKMIAQPVAQDSTLNTGLQKLADELRQRLNILRKQQVTLKNNINDINNDSNNLRKHVSGNIVGIANALKAQVNNISSKDIGNLNTDTIDNLNTEAVENIKTVEEYNPTQKKT
ncbi:hypothetical protein H012_gp648 [Acanthamoeba polyphaga moumouvirus]|uniref:Uncharacterized protein n=2 Tax=Moumouvirus TaxID=3080801 RepID=L7RC31_9VIRU|nr:hypothetical protein H012_gp648 [Acanthamoeba polyphaga moumouvirus]AGC01817.1 hypothetical protein Moumou_00273 [Acanthamoeba polyphaga moumouvirus]AQN68170.1 hypothetical protein [Saudi moumouvirus]